MIRAVLFDLDGVIRHFDPDHVAAVFNSAELGMVTHHFTDVDGLRTALSAQGVLSPRR